MDRLRKFIESLIGHRFVVIARDQHKEGKTLYLHADLMCTGCGKAKRVSAKASDFTEHIGPYEVLRVSPEDVESDAVQTRT